MELENKRDEIEIDLQELFRVILSKLVVILLVGVLGAGVAYAYTKVCVTPMYTSTTQVYILNKPDTDNLTTNDIAFATYLARDYQVLIVSDPVLKQVISNLELNMTTKSLASSISVELIEDTRIIEIKAVAETPQLAKDIADQIRNVANEKTKDVMGGIEAVNAVDEATLPVAPSSPSYFKNTAIGFVAGAGIVLLIIIIMFLMDDTIKTQEDIEKYLGISVLASIPMQKNESNSKKAKKSKKNKKDKEV